MSERNFFKTVFTIEVLADRPIDPNASLHHLNYLEGTGGAIVLVKQTGLQPLTGTDMAKNLIAHDVDPEVYGLDSDGEDLNF